MSRHDFVSPRCVYTPSEIGFLSEVVRDALSHRTCAPDAAAARLVARTIFDAYSLGINEREILLRMAVLDGKPGRSYRWLQAGAALSDDTEMAVAPC